MCWLQCCWWVLSRGLGEPRTVLRYSLLAAALLGVAMLLPGLGLYGSSVSGGSAAGGTYEYESTFGGMAGLMSFLGLSEGASGGGSDDRGSATRAVESLVEADVHHEMRRLQVALGVVLGLWVTQLLMAQLAARAAAGLLATSAASGAAADGATDAGGVRVGVAGGSEGGSAFAQEAEGSWWGPSRAYDVALPLTPNKSHLDLSSLEHLNLELPPAHNWFLPCGPALPAAGVAGACGGAAAAGAGQRGSTLGPGRARPGGSGCMDSQHMLAGCCSAGGCLGPLLSALARCVPSPFGAHRPGEVGAARAPGAASCPRLVHLLQLRRGLALRSPVAVRAAVVAVGATERVLLAAALVAQVAAAALLVDAVEPPLERISVSRAAGLLSAARDPATRVALVRHALHSWACVCLLAGAMAAPLPLPRLLRSRPLPHTALLLRPAASRRLGLQLVDLNAAMLLAAFCAAVVVGWPMGLFTWQLLQVATVLYGSLQLYTGAVRAQRAALQEAVPQLEGSLSFRKGCVGGTGAGVALPECVVAPGAAGGCGGAAGREQHAEELELPEVPLLVLKHPLRTTASAARGLAHVPSAAAGGLAHADADRAAAAAHVPGLAGGAATACVPCTAGGAPAAKPDSPAAASACLSGHSGSDTSMLLSPVSSAGSLTASSLFDAHGCLGAAKEAGRTAGGSHAAPAHGPLPATSSGHVLGHGPAAVGSTSLLARRSAVVAHTRPPPVPGEVTPLLIPGSGVTGAPLGAVGTHHGAPHGAHHGAAARGCYARLLPGSWRGSLLHAACTPWGLLCGALSALTCVLWLALIAPPLALAGDGPSDLFLWVLEDTAPGVALVLAALVVVPAVLLAAACSLAAVARSGELRRRWGADRLEGRRLQWYLWACAPPLAVALVSALSWALGEERNALAYVAAETLRCACLWPLVWLLTPWLLGGVAAVGGCHQHAGCGMTCCVLRWCGVRPCGVRPEGQRCDVPAATAAAATAGAARDRAGARGRPALA